MTKPILVGIDVASKQLVVAIGRETQGAQELVFSNDAAGHRRLIHRLTKGGRQGRVVLEATGVYHLDLALALHRARGVEVMVANPRVVRDFARASFQRSKTDKTDASVLLAFAGRMPFEAWQPPDPEVLARCARSPVEFQPSLLREPRSGTVSMRRARAKPFRRSGVVPPAVELQAVAAPIQRF